MVLFGLAIETMVNSMKNSRNVVQLLKFYRGALSCLVLLSIATSLYSQTAKSVTPVEQGVTDDTIVVGSVLPLTGSLESIGLPVKTVLTAFSEEVNIKGGINGRRLVIKFADAGSNVVNTRPTVERLIREENVFALATSNIAASEKEVSDLMGQLKTPLVGPLTLYPPAGSASNRYVFYVSAGVDTQARALVDFIASKPDLKTKKTAILYLSTLWNLQTVTAIKEELKKNALEEPQVLAYENGKFDPVQVTKQLMTTGQELVFLITTSNEAQAFFKEADNSKWYPTIFQSSALGSLDLPAQFHQKVFISFPTSPSDLTPEGIAEFRGFSQKYKLPSERAALQITSFASLKILVEGLRRAGRDLTRERFIQALESLTGYSTGLTPLISYGPNRHVGWQGAYVVSVDLEQKKFVPVSGWLEVK